MKIRRCALAAWPVTFRALFSRDHTKMSDDVSPRGPVAAKRLSGKAPPNNTMRNSRQDTAASSDAATSSPETAELHALPSSAAPRKVNISAPDLDVSDAVTKSRSHQRSSEAGRTIRPSSTTSASGAAAGAAATTPVVDGTFAQRYVRAAHVCFRASAPCRALVLLASFAATPLG